jgi:hypothetical protein
MVSKCMIRRQERITTQENVICQLELNSLPSSVHLSLHNTSLSFYAFWLHPVSCPNVHSTTIKNPNTSAILRYMSLINTGWIESLVTFHFLSQTHVHIIKNTIIQILNNSLARFHMDDPLCVTGLK